MEAEWALTGIRMRTISSLPCRHTTLSRIPFYPDAGSNRFLRNLRTCPPNYTASHPGRVECWTAPQRRTRVPQTLRCSVVTIIVVVCSGTADGYHLPGVNLWYLLSFELYWRMHNPVFRHPVLMLQQFHSDVVLATVPVFRPQREEVTGRSTNTRWTS
jgi:hypothetical protein